MTKVAKHSKSNKGPMLGSFWIFVLIMIGIVALVFGYIVIRLFLGI